MACRHFNVLNQVCVEGEDDFHTRREDVLTPLVFYKDKTLALMLRHHQVPTETERKACVANGSVHSLAQSLREVRWENLALHMAATGKKNEDKVGLAVLSRNPTNQLIHSGV